MYSLAQPGGRLALCGIHRCNQVVGSKQTTSGVHLACSRCKSRCTIPQFKMNITIPLGSHALATVKYPQDLYPAHWELPKQDGSKMDLPLPGMVVQSTSLPSTTTTIPAAIPQPFLPPKITLSPPELMIWSSSTPIITTIPPTTPSKSSLYLQIPIPQAVLTPSLSLTGPSGEGSTHSTTATPPPQSPQEPSRVKKRSFIQTCSHLFPFFIDRVPIYNPYICAYTCI